MTPAYRRFSLAVAFACVAALAWQPVALAQVTPAAPSTADAPAPALSAAELEKLVGPIALYPDDLVAIILPASTYPLQIVQASRFFDKRKANPKLEPDASWDDSVKSLLNYPDVVKKLSDDLDWTEALGEAVVANSSSVLEAVQVFRRKAQAAGNLKTDAKQVVVVEKEVIKLVPADPQIIYVPQYQASAVVVAGAPYTYYPTPYPVYYYPYPPGAAIATGIIWGAAIGAAWNGGRWGANYYGGGGNNINRSNNITVNRGGNNINTGNINRSGGGSASAWKPSRQPGQVGRPATTSRVGDARPGASGGIGAAGGGQSGFARGSAQQGSRPQAGGAGRGDGGAFGGMGSGGAAQQASARGQSSREAGGGVPQGGGARAGAGQAAGGARAGGAAGGARAGGGGRRR